MNYPVIIKNINLVKDNKIIRRKVPSACIGKELTKEEYANAINDLKEKYHCEIDTHIKWL